MNAWPALQPRGGGGGGSSIAKVPGDVPPARVYFFKLSSLAKGIRFSYFSPFSLAKVCFLAILIDFGLGKVCFLAISVKEMSNFGNSCKETQIFSNFWSRECKTLQVLSRKCH